VVDSRDIPLIPTPMAGPILPLHTPTIERVPRGEIATSGALPDLRDAPAGRLSEPVWARSSVTGPGSPRHVQERQTVRASWGYSGVPSLTSSGHLQREQHCFPWLSIVRSFLTSALERRRLEELRSTELRIPGPVLLREAIQSRHFLFSSDLPFGSGILPGTMIRYWRGRG